MKDDAVRAHAASPARIVSKGDNNETGIVPFLKWAGGKRWLVHNHANLFPQEFGTYYEPFLGAGSVYFHLRPANAVLGDRNAELINTYQGIKANWKALESSLEYRHRRHRRDPDGYYYWLRQRSSKELIQVATRFIYLNRTCFNGVYRVNQQGKFNVPRGTKENVISDTDNFEAVSNLLQSAELVTGDFELLVNRAEKNDFVFCDPPYTVRHNYNGFVKYNEVLFSWSDQERLAAALKRAAQRGVKVLCTNANHVSVKDLYRNSSFSLRVVSRFSRISADTSSRCHFEELVISANI